MSQRTFELVMFVLCLNLGFYITVTSISIHFKQKDSNVK